MTEPKKKHKRLINFISNIISLFFTLLLVYLLINNIQKIQSGTASSTTIIVTIIECLVLFIITLCSSLNKGRGNPHLDKQKIKPYKSPFLESEKEQKERNAKMKIYKPPIPHSDINSVLYTRCPHCNHKNPMKARICYKCGKRVY